ncbi:MAG: hypothetical protein HUJ25_14950 [Crocinitomicaceae bacterium]|nr:hypothetical protein [Crocinitomicaceae bacterium]
MKISSLFFSLFIVSATSFGQNEPSKELPPVEMLPKKGEVKKIYELPVETEYKVYDSNGKLLTAGFGQFIDYTDYEKGTYFIRYNNKSVQLEKE